MKLPLLISALFFGAAIDPRTGTADGRFSASGDHDITYAQAIIELTKAMDTADKVLVYEGLPKPRLEGELFEREKKTKECKLIDDQWVYAKPQTASFETTGRLQMIGARAFVPFGGTKMCGGFHADYAVAWIKDNVTTTAIICFGCHEVRLLRTYQPFTSDLNSKEFRLTMDISESGYAELRKLLSTYRKERPESLPLKDSAVGPVKKL